MGIKYCWSIKCIGYDDIVYKEKELNDLHDFDKDNNYFDTKFEYVKCKILFRCLLSKIVNYVYFTDLLQVYKLINIFWSFLLDFTFNDE